MVAFALVASFLAIGRQRDYRTYRNDMGNMVQIVDQTAHGHLFAMTSWDGRQISRLGSHVDPIVAVFALPWLVWPDPAMLLIAQAVLVALAAWPAYRLGLRALGDPMAAAGCAAAVLLYPPLQFVVLDEFHPVTLAIPFLLFAFVALEEDRRWTAVPFLVLAALCKEEIPLVIALMGAYFALRKRRLWPLVITAAGLAYFGVAAGVVIPHFNETKNTFLDRYSGGEAGLGSLAKTLLRHPGRLVAGLLGPGGLAYLVKLLWPFGFTSLASPLTFLVGLPELLINTLSSKPQQQSIAYHYVAGEAPFVIAAMVLGLRRVAGWIARWRPTAGDDERPAPAAPDAALAESPASALAESPAAGAAAAGAASESAAPDATGRPPAPAPPGSRRLRRLLVAAVVGVALVATLTVGPLSGARPGWGRVLTPEHRAVVAEALRLVPPDASVSADNALGAQLSERARVDIFPVVGDSEFVVLDSQGRYGPRRAKALAKLRADPRYTLVFEREGVLVFRRAQ